MNQSEKRSERIIEFILGNVSKHPNDITIFTAEKFDISRQAVLRHLHKLVNEGTITVDGRTKNRIYALAPIAEYSQEFLIDGLTEDRIWRERMRPLLENVPPNILAICEYGFTEMLNNAIDHSEGIGVHIDLLYTYSKIKIWIVDDGIGIFKKIQEKFNLDDQRHAILELSKGKLTTDPEHHTGEGIFFTSRMFDSFSILSNSLFFDHTLDDNDWLLERDTSRGNSPGTMITMEIGTHSHRTVQSVFDYYASTDGDFGFSKTHIPVTLAKYGDENLISRSQAKRLLARIDRFREVIFDFKGVEMIGQAFSDEVFRVFQVQNPQIHLYWINTNEQIEKMILRAKGYTSDDKLA